MRFDITTAWWVGKWEGCINFFSLDWSFDYEYKKHIAVHVLCFYLTLEW